MQRFRTEAAEPQRARAAWVTTPQATDIAKDSEATWVDYAPPADRDKQSSGPSKLVYVAVLASLVPYVLLFGAVKPDGPGYQFYLFCILFMIGAAALLVWLPSRMTPDRPDPFWQGRPMDTVREWPVTIDVVQNDVVTGTDTGRLWIHDRSIYYVGKRTSFVLSRWQLASGYAVKRHKNPFRPLQRVIQVELARLGTTIDWSLQIDLHRAHQADELAERLEEVAREPDPFQMGQFPPRSLGPERPGRRDLWIALAKIPFSETTGLVALFGIGVVWFLNWSGSLASAFIPSVILCLVALLGVGPKMALALKALRNHSRVVAEADR